MSKKIRVKPAVKPVTLNQSEYLSLSPSFLLKLRRRLKLAINKDVAKTIADSK